MKAMDSWGRLGAQAHEVRIPGDIGGLSQMLQQQAQGGAPPGLAYGMGRSYGDVCLNAGGTLWQTTALDHFISLDPASGRLVCEAGVLLRDIQQLAVPRGWILPVTPGTQLVTVGGAIANDVHGKNHHVTGSFGNHVRGLRLLRTTGEVIECGPDAQPQWFSATVGGLGLTGVIALAEIQLRPVAGPWLATETLPFNHLDEFFPLADASEAAWEHTVAWIDCLSAADAGLSCAATSLPPRTVRRPAAAR